MKNDLSYLERWCDDLIENIGNLRDEHEKYSKSWNYYHGYIGALQDIKEHFDLSIKE